VLLGPRQAGKTTLALVEMARCKDAIYLDLELPSAQRQLEDPEAFLLEQRNRLVILDEVQRMPELFALLRGVIDIRRRGGETAGQFLLLGSATGVLLQQASESLAGRVAQLELTQQHQIGEVNESLPAHVDCVNPKYATLHNDEFLYTSHREQGRLHLAM
jgi:predicted AAA+ superfamily ATPase